MEIPYYLPLSDEDTPKVRWDKVEIGVVAGTWEGVKGPAKTYSPQTLLRGTAQKGARFDIALPETYNAMVYLLDGKGEVNTSPVEGRNLVWFQNDGEGFIMEVMEDCRFIVLAGEPLSEEVSTYGPFVMNSHTEVMEALRDAQMGKMGVLIEEFK
jgi:hypothetical protein